MRCASAFPSLASPRREDICYATQNRQDAVKELIANCDVLIVVGSITSSNSNRLRELAERAGRPGYLIDDASFLKREWFEGKNAVGVTAGASAPEELVQQVVARLREWGGTAAEELEGPRGTRGVLVAARSARPPRRAADRLSAPAIRASIRSVRHRRRVAARSDRAIVRRSASRPPGPASAVTRAVGDVGEPIGARR